jgi:hypothetical protein
VKKISMRSCHLATACVELFPSTHLVTAFFLTRGFSLWTQSSSC